MAVSGAAQAVGQRVGVDAVDGGFARAIDIGDEQAARNARLIVAAPELLAALESLADELQAERPCPDVLRALLIPAALRAIEAAK